jgi:uncharacterized protein (DUF983 family)
MPRSMHPILNKPLEHSTIEKIAILFGRGLLLHCPACNQCGLFASLYALKQSCPGCGLLLQREGDGYELGSMILNVVVAELIWVVAFVSILVWTWPSPPWVLLQWGSAVLMVALPLAFLRHARVLSLALDLLVRPPERRELVRQPRTRPSR